MLATGPAATKDDYILVTEGLTKVFGGFSAVSDVNLQVRRGSIHALIGPNGAGKTTCFNMLTKFLNPTRGRILYDGRDITAIKPADVARLGLVRSFQISAVFPHLTAIENVRIALQRKRGDSFDFWRSKRVLDALNPRAEELLADVGLSEFANVTAGEMSYGRKRALEIATTLGADGRHGPRGRRARRRLDQARLGQSHRPDGRAQSAGRRQSLRQDHGPDAGTRARRGRLRHRVEKRGSAAGLSRGRA